jgi:hypothetical protein
VLLTGRAITQLHRVTNIFDTNLVDRDTPMIGA